MTSAIDTSSAAEIGAQLNRSDEAATEMAAVVDSSVKQINDYRARQERSQKTRDAQKARFQDAHEWIRRINRGWSPISNRELAARTIEERQRARWARNKRASRAKVASPKDRKPEIALVTITSECFAYRLASLRSWLALPDPRQRHLRGRDGDIMRAWVLYHDQVIIHARGPTLAEFARAFQVRFKQPMTRQMADKRLKLLLALEAEGGPWATER
jgi:hypothetical protein